MTKERLIELSAAAKYRSTAVLLVKSLQRGGDPVKAAPIRVPPIRIEPHELAELIAIALEHTGDEK